MTYTEYTELKNRMTKAEEEYLKAWKDKNMRKARKLAAELQELENRITNSRHYH